MGLTDAQMLGLIQQSLPDIETAPIEHEVRAAVGSYLFALLKTNRNGVFHRFMCWADDKEALARAAALELAKKRAKAILAKSPEHRLFLEQLVREQPSDLAKKDNLLSLLDGSLNPPAPEPGWITIGAKNDAVPPSHWFYLFHIVPDQPDKPFCFEESVGGGHMAGGGAIQLGLFELDDWPGDWRNHVVKAGCPWVAEIIDTRLSDNVQDLITTILARRNS